MSVDYQSRSYLSVQEVSHYTGYSVSEIHKYVKLGKIVAFRSTSGQYRFKFSNIEKFCQFIQKNDIVENSNIKNNSDLTINIKGNTQRIINTDARDLSLLPSGSVHLVVTSPPYFNAKMYSVESQEGKKKDLGNIHDLEIWFDEITKVWQEVFRVLQAGRKFFLNIMNLPVRYDKTFRTLNLVGKSIEACESVGFVFKRDIIWHKTNGVRAHFGTFPYPGGILLNNMHEFILEFEKLGNSAKKYSHLSKEQKEESKIDKEFWLSLKNSDVWLMKPEKSGHRREHIAPFPLELPERLIRAYSYIGEKVLDPFMGSGTTLLAAQNHGRHGIGVDVNADFYDLAKRRLSNNENESNAQKQKDMSF